MNNRELEIYLNNFLNADRIKDYCPNGLQVEGKSEVHQLVTGVTASEALIDASIEAGADALLVHHGYFWKGERQAIAGMKKRRIAKLLANDINLYAYHLPLDVHEQVGNNAQLGDLFGLQDIQPVPLVEPLGVLMQGRFAHAQNVDEIAENIERVLGRAPLTEASGKQEALTAAWCTGGGQGYIDAAVEAGVDLFITGEVSEQTIHSAREQQINFIAAGHHATERYGVKALGQHLQSAFDLDVEFIDIDNPA